MVTLHVYVLNICLTELIVLPNSWDIFCDFADGPSFSLTTETMMLDVVRKVIKKAVGTWEAHNVSVRM